uniref:C2H2-type domain-containing protein n=1 Tax=Anopheles gambiae TaxID=7165 RepID=A0A0E4G875_ANOGA
MSAVKDSSNTSIICRLPLNRLESIIGSLKNMKKRSDHMATTLIDIDSIPEEPDQINSFAVGLDNVKDVPSTNNIAYKVLCLYCDRSFSNHKLMIKHTDRIHRIAKERRSSARVLSTLANGSDVSTCCNFCHKSKALNLISDDLQTLFKHLISAHSDRYFACERCTMRFPNDAARDAHMDAFHPSSTTRRPKSKAALKAFSHTQNSTSQHSQQLVTNALNIKMHKTGVYSEINDQVEFNSVRQSVSSSLSNSNIKSELAAQNICLRSSLRNSTAPSPQKVTDSNKSKTKAFKKSERLLRRNSEPMLLSRLGITQHRLPRQSRRLMAAASSSANVTLLSSATSSTSTTQSIHSTTVPACAKFATKKKSLGTANEEGQSFQNCYNKIIKLKTIRSSLTANSVVCDPSMTETTETNKTLAKGSDVAALANIVVLNTGSSSDVSVGIFTRGTNSSVFVSNNDWGNITASTGSNSCNGNNLLQVNNSGVFDEDFYDNVTRNVKNNLCCHLDGKLEALTPNAPCPTSPVAVIPTVRSTVVKSPVSSDSKIHEATNLPAISAMFPTLLTAEQYGPEPRQTTTNSSIISLSSASSVKTKKPVTKNSWKWKWDFVKKYTYVNENGRIVKKIKQPTIGLRDLSKLDMWTQLTMRTKHELFQHQRSSDSRNQFQLSKTKFGISDEGHSITVADVGAILRDEKRAMVEQLDCLLDARLLPQIDLEQNEQRIIKIEPIDQDKTTEETCFVDDQLPNDTVSREESSSLVPWTDKKNSSEESKSLDFLQNLQLMQLNSNDLQTRVVLSGEWARPRCYICYGCGAKFNSLKQVEEHRIFRHPHVHSTFYEIVGRELIEKRLYKHFFVPFMALAMHHLYFVRLSNSELFLNSSMFGSNSQHKGEYRINNPAEIKNEDSSSNEATSFSTSTIASSSSYRYSTNSSVVTLMDNCSNGTNTLTTFNDLANHDVLENEGIGIRSATCSKCQKECQNQIVLYAHILHCSNDYVWLQAKKRMKYRRAKRRRGGNRSGGNCASSMLTVPRIAQHHQNAVGKEESAVVAPLPSLVDEKSILSVGAVSRTIIIGSKDSCSNSSCSISGSSYKNSNTSTSSISSVGSVIDNEISTSNGSQKYNKSPKRKENDSDIVKRLLANLPAKRISRQINLQTTKQISKRSMTPAKKFCSEAMVVTPKVKGQGELEKNDAVVKHPSEVCGEHVAVQSTALKNVAVTNGNSIGGIKKITSSISLSKREKVSTKLRSKQSAAVLPSMNNTMHVSTKQTQQSMRKKNNTMFQPTLGVANHKRNSKHFSNREENSVKFKGKKMEKVNRVGLINKNRMMLWKQSQRQIIRLTTSNGHHRILRSTGKRLLPVSISICNREHSLRLGRMNNEINKNSILNENSLKSKDEALDENGFVILDDPGKEAKVCKNSTEKNIFNNMETMSKKASIEKNRSSNQNNDIDKKVDQSIKINERVPTVETIEYENSLNIPCNPLQVTPTQPIKPQHLKDPPSTPIKNNDIITFSQIIIPETLSSVATVLEPSKPLTTQLGNQPMVCKSKKKKLNDCIAMLTGKLSERLGVDFFNNENDVINSVETPQNKLKDSLSLLNLVQPIKSNTSTIVSDEFVNKPKGAESCQTKTQYSSICSSLPVAANDITINSPMLSNSNIPAMISLHSKNHHNHVKYDDVGSLSHMLPPAMSLEQSVLNLAEEHISDEPLNLSKYGLVERVNKAHTKDYSNILNMTVPQSEHESLISSNSTSTALQTNHLKQVIASCSQNTNRSIEITANMYPQNVSKLKVVPPTMLDTVNTIPSNVGGGNIPSLKLPPGLIIERVEYKQARPIITKEAPSVTIVARQRTVPVQPMMSENSATDLTIEPLKSVTQGSNFNTTSSNLTHFTKSLPNRSSFVQYKSDSNHLKVTGKYTVANIIPRRSELTKDSISGGGCGENHISVTITESNTPYHERISDTANLQETVDLSPDHNQVVSSGCLPSRKALINLTTKSPNPPCKSSSIALSPLHTTSISGIGHMVGSVEKITQAVPTLIIPQVPMPSLSQAAHPTKRARRKSVFVPLPVPSVEPKRDAMTKYLIHSHPSAITAASSAISNNANLLSSMSLSFVTPGLLPVTTTPMLEPFNAQRLASIKLPAHLQPPEIPPLKIPDTAASSTALLEKIFQPTHSEVLSTGLELKKDSQCMNTKQLSLQPSPMHTKDYNKTVEENSNFISFPMPTNSNINGLSKQFEQVSKTNTALCMRTEETRSSNMAIKSNASSGMSKSGGRIMKRRASVADLQRKALMEQIWNQSILDKMMHEKDTRFVSEKENEQEVVKMQNPPIGTVIEKSNNLKILDEQMNLTIGESTTIPQINLNNPSNSASGSNPKKKENQTIKEACSLENDILSKTNVIAPVKHCKTIANQSIEIYHQLQSSTVITPTMVQEERKEITKMPQNTHIDYNQQTNHIEQEKQNSSIQSGCTLKHSQPTVDKEQCVLLTNEIEPAVLTPSIKDASNIRSIDGVKETQEEISVDAFVSQVKASPTKIIRKRRKNELASILSDQLLESFKEVDKSRLDDLKLLHDLTCETPDVKFSLEQIPQLAKRKSNPRMPDLLIHDSSKTVTSSSTAPKKVCSSKRLTKDKELTRSELSVKEANNKSTNEISTSITTSSSKVKGTQTKEGSPDLIANNYESLKYSSTDIKCLANFSSKANEKNTTNERCAQFNIEKNTLAEQLAGSKTTRSKTQYSCNSTKTVAACLQNKKTEKIQGCKTTTPKYHKPIDSVIGKARAGDNNSLLKDNLDTSTTNLIANDPKRIMSRRKSIFVDCDLSQYVEKEEWKNKIKSSNSSIKDDIMLTSRPGTRSQGQLGLDLVQSFVEATMKPRDPRRRILQQRREEDFCPVKSDGTKLSIPKQVKIAGKNITEQEENMVKLTDEYGAVDVIPKDIDKKQTPVAEVIEKNAPLRRISARRASLCVRSTMSLISSQEKYSIVAPPVEVTSKEDEHLHDIGNEVKRIYKRRASIYQIPNEFQEHGLGNSEELNPRKSTLHREENTLKKKDISSNKSSNRRSKTPVPTDWKRRNQLPLNGTSEPLIESLLQFAPSIESSTPKRRTTKNSQIAETVSKLFNIQEEIMLIDSSRRKPRKVNSSTVPSNNTSIMSSNQESCQKTIDRTNFNAFENQKSETMSLYDTSAVPSTQKPTKSSSFSNDKDESPKGIKKIVENTIINTTNSSSGSTDYSDDDNMSLACFAARSNAVQHQSTDMFAKPSKSIQLCITGRATSVIADDESTTNTEAFDEDIMSVSTEIPTVTNTSRLGNRGVRSKRRKSQKHSTSKIKRQQVKSQMQNSKPIQSFNCELCRKVFKKQDAYNKHRMTLSHIAKLSEQEYLVAQQNQGPDHSLHLANDNLLHDPKTNQGKLITKETIELNEKLLEIPAVPTAAPTTLSTMPSLAKTLIEKIKDHTEKPVKELSQEEKLFYECCSMLKESNSNENDKLKSVTTMSLKSNEANLSDMSSIIHINEVNNTSTPVLSTNLASSMEQNPMRLSTVKCSVMDEFETTHNDVTLTQEEPINQKKQRELDGNVHFMTHAYVIPNQLGNDSAQISMHTSMVSGTSGGSNNNGSNAKIKTKGALKGYDNFKVSIPMSGLTVMSANATNNCISIGKESRLDTLADVALCGDIPKEFGIVEQSEEIISTSVKDNVNACPEARLRFPLIKTVSMTNDQAHASSPRLLEPIKTERNIEMKINKITARRTGISMSKSVKLNKTGFLKNREYTIKSAKKPSSRWATGPYRRRMYKNNPPLNTVADDEEDVYAFQDSPCDGVLPSSYSSKKIITSIQNQNLMKKEEGSKLNLKHNSSTIQAPTLEDHEDSQMSSLSFSDRDDFVYGTNTMSEEEEEEKEEEEEDDKNSSISSSEQTTPKKLTTADVQKKSLIMGRIFKKGGAKDKLVSDSGVRKKSTSVPENIVIEPAKDAGTAANSSKSSSTVKSPAKDFDKLFDTLKNAADPSCQHNSNESASEYDNLPKDSFCAELFETSDNNIEVKVSKQDVNTRQQYRVVQHKHESKKYGPDRLRRQRAAHQKNLTETWDSEEFEDFQTDDIIKLINITEDNEVNDHISSKIKGPVSRLAEEAIVTQSSLIRDICQNERQLRNTENISEKHSGLKRGMQSLNEKKTSKLDTAVTDDTIRKVMESVILETMGKSCNITKRKPIVAIGTTHSIELNNKPLQLTCNNDNSVHNCQTPNVSTEDVSLALELTSLEEHTLESSVVISSKTITSKFKQKLNSSLHHNPRESEPQISSGEKDKEHNSIELNHLINESYYTADALHDSNIKSLTVNNNNNNNNTNNNNDSKGNKLASKTLKVNKSKRKPKTTQKESISKISSMSAGKQRKATQKKMKNIAYDPDSDYEQSIKCKKVKSKLLENDIEANLKIEQLQSTLFNSDDNGILLTTSRRKRNAGDMLYYWSSSSDEELHVEGKNLVGGAKEYDDIKKKYGRRRYCKSVTTNSSLGNKRGRKKKRCESSKSISNVGNASDDATSAQNDETVLKKMQVSSSSKEMRSLTTVERSKPLTLMSASKTGCKKQLLTKVENDNSLLVQKIPMQIVEETSTTSNEQLQQHGWIMGDSHKKLVTMLAHAKGKHDSRKFTNNRKK